MFLASDLRFEAYRGRGSREQDTKSNNKLPSPRDMLENLRLAGHTWARQNKVSGSLSSCNGLAVASKTPSSRNLLRLNYLGQQR